ncbi:MAG: type II toxin-antitoxin system prevent-host-death family antitoxin [Bryobacteraceae bacterium]|jgi:prevent-host-death family protein|nr:type II toxin-antitoxin system prevent-host-death family antitoxin [Solibacteraceae bacterium]MCO5350918.1 type II toxin-antitoxin system prevent-host-death family antitoxin [Bryobacteraceae bacterium]
MRTVQASEAKTHFSRLLDAVEQGETIEITRHGQVIATLAPGRDDRLDRAADAASRIRARGRRHGRVSAKEILSARDEGRKR